MMKILKVILIVGITWWIGYNKKHKYIKQKKILEDLIEFISYYRNNISLFKENILKIINDFNIMQKNKNANYIELFIENNGIYSINRQLLNNCIYDAKIFNIIENCCSGLGKSEYDYEQEKLNIFQNILLSELKNTDYDLKQKGDLFLKIMISVGITISIIVW